MDATGQPARPAQNAGKPGRIVGFVIAGLGVLAIGGYVWFQALWHVYSIPSGAMEPTLRIGDHVLARKGRFTAGQIGRGDIVIFLNDQETPWIKRVVGVGGDDVQISEGTVFLNGTALSTKQIDDYEMVDAYGQRQDAKRYLETIEDGRIHEVLDMRENSLGDNSRLFSVPADHVFVMGDNRDNSNDSRFEIGYVPVDRIVGIADRVIWSPKRDNPFQQVSLR